MNKFLSRTNPRSLGSFLWMLDYVSIGLFVGTVIEVLCSIKDIIEPGHTSSWNFGQNPPNHTSLGKS